jgi:type IV pilus assembly protein PilA
MEDVRRVNGFTLLELMIVVAIIGILASIAIPAYRDYVIESQVTEGLNLGSRVRTAMEEYYAMNGEFNAKNSNYDLPNGVDIDGNYVQRVATAGADGRFVITYGNKANSVINGDKLQFSSITGGGSIEWTCKPHYNDPIDKEYVPSSCE